MVSAEWKQAHHLLLLIIPKPVQTTRWVVSVLVGRLRIGGSSLYF